MRLQRTLPRSDAAPFLARSLIGELDAELGWRGADARLVASELVTMAERQGEHIEATLEISAAITDEFLEIEVCLHDGPAPAVFESAAGDPPDRRLSAMIMDTLADAWGGRFEAGWCLWALIDRQRTTTLPAHA